MRADPPYELRGNVKPAHVHQRRRQPIRLTAPDREAFLLTLPREVLPQLAAGGLLGLGVINWWWRGNDVGGIYRRPLSLGNLLCFIAAGASLG